MVNLDEWLQNMERLGQADIPMEIEGKWMTPREYYNQKKGR
jgi:hypothetical protein